MIYTKWQADGVDFKPIEYSGHGFRIKEPLATDLDEMVRDVIAQIDFSEDDYALLGHSMGSILVYETLKRLREMNVRMPVFVALSACEPPAVIVQRKERFQSLASDSECAIRFMLRFARMSEKRLRSTIFTESFLPYIQNDYRILAEYDSGIAEVFEMPAIVFYSKSDSLMDYQSMEGWKEHFSNLRYTEMVGNHFYIEDDENMHGMINEIKNALLSEDSDFECI